VILGNLRRPVGAAVEHERLKRAMIEHNPGYHFAAENELKMDGESGFCFNFVGSDASQRLLIDCSFPIHRLSIQYMGMKSHAPILDSIVQNIKASK
jgi:hypothetical protein